ncbi:MAG: FAD-dependent oxidoreductase [Deltaproteobacteria bacterium]|nr:FAD-dependent oxidoreductase [Deltaproteobacteria bacterium]
MEQIQVFSQIHGEKCWPIVGKLSPCEDACPVHTDVPSYVMAIAQGKFREALDVIRQTNPFPSVCGRVCHHPCEEVCNRALVDKPIAIQWLKRTVADMGLGEKPVPVPRTKKERIAVIGSGPTGLTAAYDLVRMGYGVRVYETLPIPGGMLTAGIPEMNLPKEVALAEIDYIRGLGVDIRTNSALGRDFSIDDLWAWGVKAILIAVGKQKSSELPIPGADLGSVFLALPLLKRIRLGEKVAFKGRVVVIGGGNVAMDVARTVLRLGAGEVHLACLEARRDMPAFDWEIEAAEREGVKFHPSLAPQRFIEKKGKAVGAVAFKRVARTWLDQEGKIHWDLLEGPGSEFTMDADAVIVAIGQAADVPEKDRLDLTSLGTIAVNPVTLMTGISGVFAGGDAVVAGGTAIEAIAAGHRAAESIDRYLQGVQPYAETSPEKDVLKLDPANIPNFFIRKERWSMPHLPVKDALRCFREVNLGYTNWEAVEEAKRCLNCRSCVNCVFERGQLCFETAQRLL